MNLKLSGHQIDLTPALREYVEGKLDRIVRHFDHVIDVNVVMEVQKLIHRCEMTLHTVPNKTLHAEAEASDMYAAIDALVDKLDAQIRKHKEKLTDHHRGAAQRLRQSV